LSQFTLTQPPAASASLAGTAQLSCTISSSFGGFQWYQHKAGRSPNFILLRDINKDKTDIGPEFSSRFSPSNDAPKKVAYLTITNVQAGDEADYYCAAWEETGSHGYLKDVKMSTLNCKTENLINSLERKKKKRNSEQNETEMPQKRHGWLTL
uniref:Ig-like domain-containing protein n=1 Tax=Podarcis muralis TaxID=64176 RepID=A0A670K0K4_PODMU